MTGVSSQTNEIHIDATGGVLWRVRCGICQHAMATHFHLDAPLGVGNQCSRCLTILDTSAIADAIRGYWETRA